MKKALIIILGIIVIAVAAVLIRLGAIASDVVKNAINTYGPQMTETAVTVESVGIQPYIGQGTIEDLKVGNPEGYKAPDAFTLKRIHISMDPMSVLSDTIVIDNIEIEEPVFVYERKLLSSNINTLIDTIKQNTGKTDEMAEEQAEEEEPGTDAGTQQKKFVINRIVVTDGTVQVGVLGQSTDVSLPEIKLENFSPEGITAAQATNEILNAVLSRVIVAATELAAKSIADPAGTVKGITDTALDTVGDAGDKVGGAIEGLFGGSKKEESGEGK